MIFWNSWENEMTHAVTSVRLYQYQIKRFPPECGARIIEFALRRWRAGELGDAVRNALVLQSRLDRSKPQNVLREFSIRFCSEPGVDARLIRAIIDAHYKVAVKQWDGELKVVSAYIENYTAAMPPVIMETV
jgi:hypothetical protein